MCESIGGTFQRNKDGLQCDFQTTVEFLRHCEILAGKITFFAINNHYQINILGMQSQCVLYNILSQLCNRFIGILLQSTSCTYEICSIPELCFVGSFETFALWIVRNNTYKNHCDIFYSVLMLPEIHFTISIASVVLFIDTASVCPVNTSSVCPINTCERNTLIFIISKIT